MNPIPESWRTVAIVVCLIAATAALYWFLFSFDPFGRREKAEERATVATAQSDLNAGATGAVANVLRATEHANTQAEEATRNVDAAQDAAAVLDAHVAGIGRMREGPAAGPDPGS